MEKNTNIEKDSVLKRANNASQDKKDWFFALVGYILILATFVGLFAYGVVLLIDSIRLVVAEGNYYVVAVIAMVAYLIFCAFSIFYSAVMLYYTNDMQIYKEKNNLILLNALITLLFIIGLTIFGIQVVEQSKVIVLIVSVSATWLLLVGNVFAILGARTRIDSNEISEEGLEQPTISAEQIQNDD